MTLIVKSASEDAISLPARLMAILNLHDGDEVKAIVEGETLRVTRLANFLELRGALADDDAFDDALEQLDQAWRAWTPPPSV